MTPCNVKYYNIIKKKKSTEANISLLLDLLEICIKRPESHSVFYLQYLFLIESTYLYHDLPEVTSRNRVIYLPTFFVNILSYKYLSSHLYKNLFYANQTFNYFTKWHHSHYVHYSNLYYTHLKFPVLLCRYLPLSRFIWRNQSYQSTLFTYLLL